MKRPTIPDLAVAAGVSISTVNRVINQADSVRQHTRERVLLAAENIGFYGLGSIEHSVRQGRETHRLCVLLQQPSLSQSGNERERVPLIFPRAQFELHSA